MNAEFVYVKWKMKRKPNWKLKMFVVMLRDNQTKTTSV